MPVCHKCNQQILSGDPRCANCGTRIPPVEFFEHELKVLSGAQYPVIYTVSSEEEPVLHCLLDVARTMNRKLYQWTVSEGLKAIAASSDKDTARPAVEEGSLLKKGAQVLPGGDTRNALTALNKIHDSSERAIFVFKDFHPFLDETAPRQGQDPAVLCRRLRDIVQNFRRMPKTLLLLSPVLVIPKELEKEIVVLDFPLPPVEEIKEILHKKVAHYQTQLGLCVSDSLVERFSKAALGLTRAEVENVFNKALVNDRKFDENDLPLIIEEKKQILRKTGLLEYYDVNEALGNVGGLNNLKDWLEKRGKAFSDEARAFGLPEPKGILLLGVQGCGKSLISKAIGALWRLPLLRFDLGRIFGAYVGESESNLRKALKVAEALAPTILWIDEIEKGFAGVGGGSGGDSGVGTRIFGSFITWMQEKTAPVFVIATANSIENLPPELLRKGRFDEIFFVDLPKTPEREEIFRIHLHKRHRDPAAFDLKQITEVSDGFSGAEIEQAVIAALYDAYHEGSDITTDLVVRSVKDTVPLSKTMKEKIDHLRRWAATRARPATVEEAHEPVAAANTPQKAAAKENGWLDLGSGDLDFS